ADFTLSEVHHLQCAGILNQSVNIIDKLFHSDAVPIDHLIAPEQLVIDNIYRLIEYPGALQVVNFAEGKVS
ncbi:hypothetical protein ACUOFC_68460, partial [Escherichia sp. TWPC-MK]